MFIDTHCHLDFPEFDKDRDEVARAAKNEGIDYIINIGSGLAASEKAIELSRRYDFIYATVGIHPHDADKFEDKLKARVRELAGQDKVVAIGETGLDYYRNYAKAENQKILFSYLVRLAKDLNLPLVIHNRQAGEETLKILKEARPEKAVVHCFSGDTDFLKKCLDAGLHISFTCNLTYKKAQGLREVAKTTPLERLMLETDAPFLPPEGLRGKRNEPRFVKFLAEELAGIKGMGVEEIARVTTQNAKNFFRLE